MKFKILASTAVILLLGCFLTAPSFAASVGKKGGIKWYGYEEGRQRALSEGKKIFLHFTAKWCGYCAKMNKETFANRPVVRYLNDNYVSIVVDFDHQRKIAAKYNVRPLPMSIFLDHSGGNISKLPGYIPPEMMLKLLQFIETDSYKKMTWPQFVKSS